MYTLYFSFCVPVFDKYKHNFLFQIVHQSTPIKSELQSRMPTLDTTIVTGNGEAPNVHDLPDANKFRSVHPKSQQWPNEFVCTDDRQSLTNFEEFEKSMSLCQNEKDFEQMLNKLGRSDALLSRSSDVMRQSLDHIKKRHSLMNAEKQLEDQRRSFADANRTPTAKPFMAVNMDQSYVLNLSTSGSGERLLRRSRLCDETIDLPSNGSTSSSSNSCELPLPLVPGTTNDADTSALPVPRVAIPTRDRDRFKTIRISKHVSGLAVPHILNPSCAGSDEAMPTEQQTDNRTLVEGMLAPRRRLQRPSQLSGITRRDASLGVTRTIVAPQVIPSGDAIVTSPMGNKAKSIHNLATGYERSKEKSAEEVNTSNQKEVYINNVNVCEALIQLIHLFSIKANHHSFKVPLPAQRLVKRSGLIRPSSGYFSYSLRRNNSDTESGRLSPTNVSLCDGSMNNDSV